MSNVKTFLEHTVEGYLFKDLGQMKAMPMPMGYPFVMTAFAGIELLGSLLSEKKFDPNSGNEYFVSYWFNCLYPSRTHANSKEIGQHLYRLARHGIAHCYLLKGPVAIVHSQPDRHLKKDDLGVIYVDAIQLADDLMDSYFKMVKNISDAVGQRMEERFKEMDKAYRKKATDDKPERVFPLYRNNGDSPEQPQQIGASGPPGPFFGSKLQRGI
ncbi:MAG: hypothetical protein K8U03_12485 [Planctomycetia bacterium]|nr:hypothetical protein [Planctomycetia bacterium]